MYTVYTNTHPEFSKHLFLTIVLEIVKGYSFHTRILFSLESKTEIRFTEESINACLEESRPRRKFWHMKIKLY